MRQAGAQEGAIGGQPLPGTRSGPATSSERNSLRRAICFDSDFWNAIKTNQNRKLHPELPSLNHQILSYNIVRASQQPCARAMPWSAFVGTTRNTCPIPLSCS